MIRLTILTLLIAYLSVYAWKDWFRAACWLVLLMAVFEHPDMPKSIADVPGLNHWNFLFVNVFCSWLVNRKKEKLTWDMPKHLNLLLFLYGFIILTSVIRYLFDHSGVDELIQTFGGSATSEISAINEYLINCFKWVIPAMIIFDGCRNRKQYNYAIVMLALMFVLLALQVIKAMKLGALTMGGDELQHKALKVLSGNVGFHRVNLSMMMSGAFWAIFCLKELVSTKLYWFFIVPACMFTFLAMALTGGRTGYATWAILGFVFCVFKWRKYLLLIPFLLMGIFTFAPSAVDRFTQGISPEDSIGRQEIKNQDIEFASNEIDLDSVTSGRVIAWPLVWESIIKAPFFGYGREAMKNIGLTQKIFTESGGSEGFTHPHNSYLQWLQDNGFVGGIPVFIFYFLIIKYSWGLFRDGKYSIYVVTGGISLALVSAFLIAGIGSQNFYPREGAVGMWVAIGLMLRVHVERMKTEQRKESELMKLSEE
ncbi:polymerase [Psychromonas sp. MB-3u-54]|uniref:O-antigen ligase family protein n=1 Tax=Psychromonas sp. MB-3u-54 TaxID=2058319 RepID=UPI000C336D52|nr:O-antigen ligase family protein [Psychromonas sp. MB-3u-54]PKH01066.1 polymerase [Psychromonas sp. MB-3u-54]